jgi:hypothetical protein
MVFAIVIPNALVAAFALWMAIEYVRPGASARRRDD